MQNISNENLSSNHDGSWSVKKITDRQSHFNPHGSKTIPPRHPSTPPASNWEKKSPTTPISAIQPTSLEVHPSSHFYLLSQLFQSRKKTRTASILRRTRRWNRNLVWERPRGMNLRFRGLTPRRPLPPPFYHHGPLSRTMTIERARTFRPVAWPQWRRRRRRRHKKSEEDVTLSLEPCPVAWPQWRRRRRRRHKKSEEDVNVIHCWFVSS